MVYCIGLTGGIGCGKSTVAAAFAQLGAAIIDTDAISHALTARGAAGYQAIVKRFGTEILLPSGALDRARLRQRIFSDAQAKQQLEAILHPLIRTEVLAQLAPCQAPYALLVVPLLFETEHYLPLLQRILVVDCAEATQIRRAMARSALTEQEVRNIMAQQLSRAARLPRADDVLSNEGDLASLQQAVAALDARYRSLSAAAAKS